MSDEWLSAKAIDCWWASPTQKGIRRPYGPKSVVALRDPFPENIAANAMALRLRAVLEKHHRARTINLTTSPLEMSSQQMMAEAGMETAYVSGGLASFTAVDDPSSDHADYPYDTLPQKVALLHRAQLMNARIARSKGRAGHDACMLPLIADADSGFGQYTTVMKLVKMMVQAGAAGIHLDDLFPGTKRFDGKDGEGWTIVPTCELLKRLTAARLQLDIMGSDMVVVYRADPHNATRITASVDPRDRPFILGATVELERDYANLSTSPERAEWKEKAFLKTLDQAFKDAYPRQYQEFAAKTTGLNISEAQRIALKFAPQFYFSADAARNSLGHYAFRGTIEASIARSLLAAPLAEMLWANAGAYVPYDTETYATVLRDKIPDKWLGYNVTGAFPTDGSLDSEAKLLNEKLAKLGYCWQFMPLALFTGLGLQAKRLARGMLQGGTYYYLENVSRPAAKEAGEEDSVEWFYKKGAALTDSAAEIIGDCI